ncbi:hypothetical protein GCM10008119_26600 [Pedobacter mendelii]|uniref:Uncharacterized protein n=1 Tax=Pedobacter mendelii TaxID=1908240 RepID=A0ABQ2BKE0_9SPHI|nr:hypothetical protein GCM10008119_26600 [Pedobacter mendelii]
MLIISLRENLKTVVSGWPWGLSSNWAEGRSEYFGETGSYTILAAIFMKHKSKIFFRAGHDFVSKASAGMVFTYSLK